MPDNQQERLFQKAKSRMAPYADKVVFHRMTTLEAALLVPDNSLDYVYIDARHDYCGVKEDLEAWWPKLRKGGVFAGHDYIEASDPVLPDDEHWEVCGDGSKNPGAVKGAVDEFAASVGATPLITYREDFPTWAWIKE